MRFSTNSLLPAMACAIAGHIFAQSDSRIAEMAALQERKAAALKADEPGKIERGLLWLQDQDPLGRLSEGMGGFRPKFGGLGAGTCFAPGVEYMRTGLLNGRMTFRSSAQASFRGDRKMDLEVGAPHIAGGRYFVQFYAVHHDYPRLNYYGPGPDSQKTGRTDFRLEDTALDVIAGARLVKHLTIGSSAGYVLNNVGAGTDPRFASAETVYSPSQAIGIDRQANYLRTGAFAQYDWRDNPDGPRRGGNYVAQFSDYRDRTASTGDFRRLDVEAQQFIPVLNDRRVFAFRAKSTTSYTAAGAAIPFYMQPSLGGSEDLRGYRPYRFRGDNLLLMSAEYRWEIFSGLDMAMFGDAGKVYNHRSELALNELESDIGIGLRFNQRNKTFLRIDAAFSHEGFQVWVRFNNVFKKGPVHTSSSLGDF